MKTKVVIFATEEILSRFTKANLGRILRSLDLPTNLPKEEMIKILISKSLMVRAEVEPLFLEDG